MEIQTSRDSITDYFSQQAESGYYEKLFKDNSHSASSELFKIRRERVASLCENLSGSLLDIACGTGEVTSAAVDAGSFDQIAINDLTRPMLEIAKGRLPGAEIHNSDVLQLNPGTKFDVVLAVGIIAHLGPNQASALFSAASKLLKRNGTIILQSTLADHWSSGIYSVVSKLRQTRRGYPIATYSRNELVNAAGEEGFILEEESRFGVGFPFIDRISRKLGYTIESRHGRHCNLPGPEWIGLFRRSEI